MGKESVFPTSQAQLLGGSCQDEMQTWSWSSTADNPMTQGLFHISEPEALVSCRTAALQGRD